MPKWVMRVIPTALEADWRAATNQGGDVDGLGVSTPIYTEADPTPRTATHLVGNAAPNASQLAYLQGLGDDANGYVQMPTSPVDLTGCLVKVYERSTTLPTDVLNGILADHGLTTQEN